MIKLFFVITFLLLTGTALFAQAWRLETYNDSKGVTDGVDKKRSKKP